MKRFAEMAAWIASILHGHIAHTMSVAPGTEASSPYTEAISGERTLIEFLELELLEADRRGDWKAISGCLAPDFLEVAGDGRYYTEEEIRRHFPETRVSDYAVTDVEYRPLGPNAALLAYHLDLHATCRGTPLLVGFLVSTVWRKDRGRWMVVFHQGTPVTHAGGAHQHAETRAV